MPTFLFNEPRSSTPFPPVDLWLLFSSHIFCRWSQITQMCSYNAAVAHNQASAEDQKTLMWSGCWFHSNIRRASALAVYQWLVSWCFVWWCPVFFCFGWSIHRELLQSLNTPDGTRDVSTTKTLSMNHYTGLWKHTMEHVTWHFTQLVDCACPIIYKICNNESRNGFLAVDLVIISRMSSSIHNMMWLVISSVTSRRCWNPPLFCASSHLCHFHSCLRVVAGSEADPIHWFSHTVPVQTSHHNLSGSQGVQRCFWVCCQTYSFVYIYIRIPRCSIC